MSNILSWPSKQANEHLYYEANFAPGLQPLEEVISHTAAVTHGTIEITDVARQGARMFLKIKGGKKDELAQVLCIVETNQGQTLALDPFLPVT